MSTCKTCGCPDFKWLRVSTVAQCFGSSSKKVRRLIKDGTLDGMQFGREWRVRHEALDRLVLQHSLLAGLEPPGAEDDER